MQLENWFNLPLCLGICAILLAQFLKVPITYIFTRKIDWSMLTTTGGMPSSHSAGVMAVAVAVGFETGFNSPTFAVAGMLAGVVMYDASGVRFQAGQHASAINEIRRDLQRILTDIKNWPDLNEKEKQHELKTLLGHKRSEVFMGALSGIFLSTIVYLFI